MNDKIALAIDYLRLTNFRDSLNRALEVLPVTSAEVALERSRDSHKKQSDDWDLVNTKRDWLCWITYYLGKAVMFEDRNLNVRANVVKACAIMVSALDAEAKGWC